MEERSHTTRRFGLWVVLLSVLFIGALIALSNKSAGPSNMVVEEAVPLSVKQCYIWKTEFGDKATLRVTTIDTNVEGSFVYLPKEKDSKKGVFTGTMSALSGDSRTRTIHGWWNVLAEGSVTRDEIIISILDRTAAVGFGEMKEQSEGTYVYADVGKLIYGPVLQETSCGDKELN